jgi:tetratricopeptide (TPR) repeat protein/CHAT domain-containing protein
MNMRRRTKSEDSGSTSDAQNRFLPFAVRSSLFALRSSLFALRSSSLPVLCLLTLFPMLTAIPAPSPTSDDLPDEYTQILKLMSKKDYGSAIAGCKKLITEQPSFDRTYRKLVEASRWEKKLDEAQEYFRSLLSQNPQNGHAYYGSGLIYRDKKEHAQALERFKKAIECSARFADVFAKLVDTYKDLGKLDEGVKYLEGLLNALPEAAYPHYGLGYLYLQQRSWQKGLAQLTRALELAPQLIEAINTQAVIYNNMNSPKAARSSYEKALALAEKKNDLEAKGKILNSLAAVETNLREHDQSLEHAQQALKIFQDIGERTLTGWVLEIIARAYSNRNDYAQAIDYFEQAVKAYQDLDNRTGAINCLQGIGIIHRMRGNYPTALDYYQRALSAAQEANNIELEAGILNSMGIAYIEIGSYSQALDRYQGALRAVQQLKDRDWERKALNNMGNVYRHLGLYPQALEYLQQSLRISQELKDARGQGNTLRNIGTVYLVLADYPKALKYYQEALQITQKSGNRQEEAEALDNIGSAYEKLRMYEKAMAQYQEVLKICREIGYPQLEGLALNGMGDVYAHLGDYDKSVEHHQLALKVGTDIHYAQIIWYSHVGLARSLEQQNKLADALDHYRQSIEEIEKVRGQLLETEYRTGFLQRRLEVYENVVALLFRWHDRDHSQGYDRAAFTYAERAKARAFLDTLAEASAHVRKGMSPQQIAEEQALFRNISRIQSALFGKQLTEKEKKRLNEELKAAENKLEDFKNQLRKNNPAYADLRYPEPYDLARAQKELLDDSSVLLEFLLGEKKSFLWLVSSQSLEMIALPKRQEIERRVRAYHKLLSEPPQGMESFAEYYKQGSQLFRLLLGPIKNKVGRNKKLIIIPDGVLHYLPFETLITASGANWETKPPRHLMDDHDVAYAPSASVLGRLNAAKHTEEDRLELLAYGDPVLNAKKGVAGKKAKPSYPERSNGTIARSQNPVRAAYAGLGINLEPLPNSKREVEALAGLYPARLRRVYLGAQATESAVKRERLSKYRRIHFATHGLIDEQVPARSGLILSASDGEEDGILQMNEIFDLELDAELVVLSACQSGLGKLVRGEGMVGLTRAFLYAGAESVVVSLWSVNDESTAEFMKSFYRHMKSGKSRSEALRLAKRAMIKSTTPAYKFPYFWAPFVLIGRAR